MPFRCALCSKEFEPGEHVLQARRLEISLEGRSYLEVYQQMVCLLPCAGVEVFHLPPESYTSRLRGG